VTIYFDKRRQKWSYTFLRGGRRFSGYCRHPKSGAFAKSKTEAREYERAIVVAAEQATTKPRQTIQQIGQRYTLAQAVLARTKVAQKTPMGKPNPEWWKTRRWLAEFLEYFGADTAIEDVAARWEQYRDWARSQKVLIYVGGPRSKDTLKKLNAARSEHALQPTGRVRSENTVNHALVELAAVFRLANKRTASGIEPPLSFMPDIKGTKLPERAPNPVPSYIIEKLRTVAPEHLAHTIDLIRLFGLRAGEAFAVTIDHIDWERRGLRFKAEETKGGRPAFMPANDEAMALLSRLSIRATKAKQRNLILFKPSQPGAILQPISTVKRSWATALEAIGLDARAFRIHDLRASFISQVAERAPQAATKKLARHKSWATTERYLKVSDKTLRAAVNALPKLNSTRRPPKSIDRSGKLPNRKIGS